MTRKEEIEKEAMLRFDSDDTNCAITAFIAGAEYADRTMLEKAYEYLKNDLRETYDRNYYPSVESRSCVSVKEFIDEFKKILIK